MDSFKIYLPSNASCDHYPNNNASNFKINLNNPIQLEGEWEAGVESIYYDNNIGDKNETSTIAVTTKTLIPTTVNDIYPYKFVLTSKQKWPYLGYYPKVIPNSSKDVETVCEALNSVNGEILENKDKKIFEFYKSNNNICFHAFTDSVIIQITANMGRRLGFDYQTRFSGSSFNTSWAKPSDQPLVKADYEVHIFEQNIVKRHERIIIKDYGEAFLTERKLETRWKKRVSEKYDIKLFFRNNKVIIQNNEKNLALAFSNAFRNIIYHREAIFTNNEWWADKAYSKNNESEIRAAEVECYVDIFKDDLAFTTTLNQSHFEHTFYPHRFTVEALLMQLNKDMKSRIQANLKDDYNVNHHYCLFSLKNNFVIIEISSLMEIALDKLLQTILGFKTANLKPGLHESHTSLTSLNKQIQQFFIHADFIQPISFGTEKHYIFQEFIHQYNYKYDIVERRFQPISYIPIARNYIDTIGIKLTNETYHPIKIKDSKTILIIHFRKVK